MAINNQAGGLKRQMEEEIQDYLTSSLQRFDGDDYSQYKLVNRITLFENHVYPTGKIDSRGHYKFWYDIITPAVQSEVKNIDFDTRNVEAYSPLNQDTFLNYIVNLRAREYLRDTGQAQKINEAIESSSGKGNHVWKKIKGEYEDIDLKNFYVINQTAETLKDSPVIERHEFSATELRAKNQVWENVKEVLENCKNETRKKSVQQTAVASTFPMYEIFERNGEVCMKDLKEAKDEEVSPGDEEKFVFAKVIAAGRSTQSNVTIEYLVFVEPLEGKTNEDIYEEYHRGPYKMRWWREGLYELLFDLQVRANQLGNQIAKGLELAGKKVFRHSDQLLVDNILSDLDNGALIRSVDLQAVDTSMPGLAQLLQEWNRIILMRNEIANSQEVVQGVTPPSGTPLGTTQLLNQNAGKLFDYIREKLGIPFSRLFEAVIGDLISEMKTQDILRLTGESSLMDQVYDALVNDWYVSNLLALGPHTSQEGQVLRDVKLQELKARPALVVTGFKELLKHYKPRVTCIITGEQYDFQSELNTYAYFVSLEPDPVRRTALIELMMRKKGIDIGSLPKSAPPSTMAPTPSPLNAALPNAKVG